MNHVPKVVLDCNSESLILLFTNAKLFQIRLSKHEKIAFWILIRLESPILRTCECTALSEWDSCMQILEMRAEAMHGMNGSICEVGTKYYLAVRRSCSWSGQRFAIWNGFWNVICSFVNRPIIMSYLCLPCGTLNGWIWCILCPSPTTSVVLQNPYSSSVMDISLYEEKQQQMKN